MHAYLAGPMTGYANDNFDAFHKAAHALRARGHRIINPAEGFEGDQSLPWETYMRADMTHILAVEAVVVLPGWRASRGAMLETTVARSIGLPLYAYQDGDAVPLTEEYVAEEAVRLVTGPRQGSYGHPLDDFTRTGKLWAAILGLNEVTPEQVGLCMVALKISRECNKPGRDNLVDGCGYFQTIELVQRERARRAHDEQAPTS